jgi:hypothetical protein
VPRLALVLRPGRAGRAAHGRNLRMGPPDPCGRRRAGVRAGGRAARASARPVEAHETLDHCRWIAVDRADRLRRPHRAHRPPRRGRAPSCHLDRRDPPAPGQYLHRHRAADRPAPARPGPRLARAGGRHARAQGRADPAAHLGHLAPGAVHPRRSGRRQHRGPRVHRVPHLQRRRLVPHLHGPRGHPDLPPPQRLPDADRRRGAGGPDAAIGTAGAPDGPDRGAGRAAGRAGRRERHLVPAHPCHRGAFRRGRAAVFGEMGRRKQAERQARSISPHS